MILNVDTSIFGSLRNNKLVKNLNIIVHSISKRKLTVITQKSHGLLEFLLFGLDNLW